MTTVLGPVVHARTRHPRTASVRSAVTASFRAHDLVWPHAFAYVVVNTMLVGSWFLVAAGSAFWPGLVIVGWGMRLATHVRTSFTGGSVTPPDPAHEGTSPRHVAAIGARHPR